MVNIVCVVGKADNLLDTVLPFVPMNISFYFESVNERADPTISLRWCLVVSGHTI